MKHTAFWMVLCLCTSTLIAQQESSTPELPADIPKDAEIRSVLTGATTSGQDAVWTTPDGVTHEFYQFNDRGRGPKTYVNYRLDARGIVIEEDSKGIDYMKVPVEERYAIDSGTASWRNQAEDKTIQNAGGKFYVDLNGGPESGAILARALLKHGNKLDILPSGQATIRAVKSVPVEASGQKARATLYAIDGLSFTPLYLWLDEQQRLFATDWGWMGMAKKGFEPVQPTLRKAQQEVEQAYAAEMAHKLTHVPKGDVVIRNVSLFDSPSAKVIPNQRVTLRGGRIVAVGSEDNQPMSTSVEVIDGKGKMLLPGLWDMHAHLFPLNAYLDVASGVTTVRDMGNDIELLTNLRQHIAEGSQIGPRVVPAGFIDGPGPFEGPVKVLAATADEARDRVAHYAELGYVQIKIYSSVKPELVPIIADEAHKRGLRVSGHVPSGMIAEQFIRDGADEIQHMNFIFLNFMPDVTETRTPARFIEPGKRGGDLDLNSQQVNDFIALLKQRRIVLDPTMGVWEGTYTDRQKHIPKIDEYMFSRLPVQVQRGIMAGGTALPVPDEQTEKRYRAAYANMERMLKKLYDSGVQIVAGTDAGSGYAFPRELEIYAESGIPPSAVLRMATLEGAQVMHKDNEFGSIAPGKYADMILVNGDPTHEISDIRKVDLVMKAGKLFRPSELYQAIGVH